MIEVLREIAEALKPKKTVQEVINPAQLGECLHDGWKFVGSVTNPIGPNWVEVYVIVEREV